MYIKRMKFNIGLKSYILSTISLLNPQEREEGTKEDMYSIHKVSDEWAMQQKIHLQIVNIENTIDVSIIKKNLSNIVYLSCVKMLKSV